MFFQALVMSAILEVGTLQGLFYDYVAPSRRTLDSPLYTALAADVAWGPLFIGGGINCFYWQRNPTFYDPFQLTFIFNAGLRWRGVELGYEHICTHPEEIYAAIRNSDMMPAYEGGYNRWYLRFKIGGARE